MIKEPEAEEFGHDDIINYAEYINSNGPHHETTPQVPPDADYEMEG